MCCQITPSANIRSMPKSLLEHVNAKLEQAVELQKNGHFAQAQAIYEEILKAEPQHSDALHLLGLVAFQTSDPLRAVELIGRAIEIHPGTADFHSNLGIALAALNKLDAAISSYDKAIKIKPDFVEAHSNRGLALAALEQLDAAIANYDKAIAIRPDFAKAYSNRGVAFETIEQLDAAIKDYDQAIAIDSDFAEAHFNRGNVLRKFGQLDAAIVSYEKAFKIKSDHEFLQGTLLNTKMEICDWNGIDILFRNLRARIERGERASQSFTVLVVDDSPALQKLAAEIWMRSKHPPRPSLGAIPMNTKTNKIRIGYYSADFRDHPVSHLSVELFETHDRDEFELIAFSYGPDLQDAMRQRVSIAFDRFIDAKAKSDRDVARASRQLKIDIAVDLGGLTSGSRAGIFSYRAAPIQLSYIGYLGTMGAEYYDYLIADKTIIPVSSQKYYSEKLAYLPNYQVNPSQRVFSEKQFTREELELPSAGFVFCCFNNNFKITPSTFDIWMRVLKKVEGSILFLYADHSPAKLNLKQEAAKRGVEPNRVIFAGLLSRPEHLSRVGVADLFLDTFPYNAGVTASDALWAGVPVLTRMGESFASRVAGSVLHAIQLPELITYCKEEYESRAIELATNPTELYEIRKKLRENRLTTPLFDVKLFAKHIEAAYTAMHERYLAGLPPDHIEILPQEYQDDKLA